MNVSLVINILIMLSIVNCTLAYKGKRDFTYIIIVWLLLGLSMWCILYATIFCRIPGELTYERILRPFYNWYKIWTIEWVGHGEYVMQESIANAFLFLPLGMCLHNLMSSTRVSIKVLCIGALFSLSIECTQNMYGLGVFQIDDLINNTWGAVSGAGICYTIRHVRDITNVISGIGVRKKIMLALLPTVVYGIVMGVVCIKAILW